MIITLDPGQTTGYALFDEKTNEFVSWGQIKLPLLNIYKLLLSAHNVYGEDLTHIYSESFNLFAGKAKTKTGSDFPEIQVIGAIKLFSQFNDIPLTENTPAQVKRVWTDDKLRKFGYYQKGNPHANDAIRHGLTVLKVHRQEEIKKLWAT